MPLLAETIAERIARHSMPEPNSGCLLWMSQYDRKGYGIVSVEGRHRMAHRIAWQEARGPIPEGLCVCHKCDVPACVNVDHLWLGTDDENKADKMAKGRQKPGAHGEQHTKARLTADLVREIRASRDGYGTLAARLGVSASTVRAVRIGKTWRRVK